MNKIDFTTEVQNVLRCNDIGFLKSLEKKYDVPNIILHPFENVMLNVCSHRRMQLKRGKKGKKYPSFNEKYWLDLYTQCCRDVEKLWNDLRK